MAIRRTFRCKAKEGRVKADGRLWNISKDGAPYSGEVVLRINVVNPSAYYEVSQNKFVFLDLEFVKRLHETGI